MSAPCEDRMRTGSESGLGRLTRTGPLRTLVLVAVLLASTFALAVPVGVVHGSIGTAQLAAVDSVPNPNAAVIALDNESVIAGSSTVVSIDGVAAPPTNIFAISFAGVTFSGSQFQLYMGINGFASIGGSDVLYGPTFSVADFANSTDSWKSYQGALGLGLTGTFYIGTTKSGTPMVAGPIAMDISDEYGFIKIFDGSLTSVGVVSGNVVTQPSIANLQVSPSSGPAGTPVQIAGGGFPTGIQVNINATYTTTPWVGSSKAHNVAWITHQSTGNGYFTTSATPMLDTKQVINTKVTGVFPSVPISFFAVNTSHVSQVMNPDQVAVGSPVFKEHSRGIASVTSYDSTGAPVDTTHGAFTPGVLFGNDTGSTGTVGSITVKDLPTISAKVFGKLYVAGNFSYVGSPVAFWVNTMSTTFIQMNTSAPVMPNSLGFWNATVTVPILSGGIHVVLISNAGVAYLMTSIASGTVTTTTTKSSTTTATSTVTSTSSTSTTSTTSTSTTTCTLGPYCPGGTTTVSTTSSSTSTITFTATATSSSTTSTSSSTTQPGNGGSDYTYLALGGVVVAVAVIASYIVLRMRRPSL